MRTLAIHALEATHPDQAAVDAWMPGRRFPIVEGGHVTLVYRGVADSVSLRHWIYGLESNQALKRMDHTDLWFLVVEIPPRSRIEYKFEVRRGGHVSWIQDPLNPHHARDPFGANSVMQGDGYEVPEWARPDPQSRAGTMEQLTLSSRALDSERQVKVYLPARFRRTRTYPLLVVHDGSDYLRFSGMQAVLDNLIHKLEIPDLIAVFSDSKDRLREYAADPGHARYLTEELLPEMARRFPLQDSAQARCLMGASFGGVASFSTAVRHPGVWGSLLLQSGSFAFTDIGRSHRRGPLFDRVVEFVNAFRDNPTAISERVFVSCGTYEPLIYENRSLVPLLDATGMQVKYVESRDGHNWENWRDRLREGLSWLMPGPLRMIYE
jgi:enterochelin esterase-like enzyme